MGPTSVFPYVRCLHLADLHLGFVPRDLSGKESERARERDGLLGRAIDFALDRRNAIDLVLIVGDLFDTRQPGPDSVEAAIRILERLVRSGVVLVTVPGNHDEITYASSVYRMCGSRWPGVLVKNPNPQLVTSMDIRGTPLHLYSLAYTGGLTRTRPAINDFPMSGAPGIHIAAFHGSLDWDAGDRSLPLDREALEKAGYSYVALGHIHAFRDYPIAETGGGSGRIVYCGAVEGKDFGDPGTGMFVVAEVSEAGSRVTTHPSGSRAYHTEGLDLSTVVSQGELDDFMQRLARTHSQDMVRLRLSGQPAFATGAGQLEARFRAEFYHLEVTGDAIEMAEPDTDAWAQEHTIRGEFVRRISARMSQAASEEERAVLQRAMLEGLSALRGSGPR